MPYFYQLVPKLNNYHTFFDIMPDFIDKLKTEIIFKDKKHIFLKNLNKIHFLDKKL